MTNNIEENAIKIINLLQKAGFIAYFAGGYIRDKILDREINDIDIATSASLQEIDSIMQKDNIRIINIGEKFGVLGALIDETLFEIATFRQEFGSADSRHPDRVEFGVTPEDDASRRDFTINGIFYDPTKKEIYDYVAGQIDIADKIIRFIGKPEERIREDALRMLRAIRFACQLDFSYEDHTAKAIQSASELITKISGERIRDEIDKTLNSNNASRGLSDLKKLGLLKYIFPEIEKLETIPQPKVFHAEGDAFAHTVEILKDLPENASSDLRWAALLHDIGKAETMQTPEKDGTDRIRFSNHDTVGAQMAANILERLHLPNERIDKICWLISHHMIFHNFLFMRVARQRRLMQNPNFADLLTLYKTDAIASIPSTSEGKIRKPDLRVYYLVEDIYKEELARPIEPERLVNGNNIMKILHIPAGPRIGELLEAIRDRQLEGELKNSDDAIKYLESLK